MAFALSRLLRTLLVSIAALGTAFGALPDVICCCNISFGPAGLLFTSAPTPPTDEPHCSCCREKSQKSREAGPVVAQCQPACHYHLEPNPDAVLVSSASMSSPVALALDLSLPSGSLDQIELLGSVPVPGSEMAATRNRGCALRQVWLI